TEPVRLTWRNAFIVSTLHLRCRNRWPFLSRSRRVCSHVKSPLASGHLVVDQCIEVHRQLARTKFGGRILECARPDCCGDIDRHRHRSNCRPPKKRNFLTKTQLALAAFLCLLPC